MNAVQGDRVGATRGKLAVIGLLAVVLVGVLASNFRGDAGPAAELAVSSEATRPRLRPRAIGAAAFSPAAPDSSATPDSESPFGKFAADADWPDYSLDELVRFDPLAAPTWNAPAVAASGSEGGGESQAAALQQLQEAQNAIILVSGNERVARIGSQEYRVGDAVGPYLITGISSAGIVLSEPSKGDAPAR
jgi:hypothetical protein